MALPSSGSISLNQVNIELGRSGTTTISLNDTIVRTLFGVVSGSITMSNGLGKANQFTLTIATDTANLNVRTAALAAGWNGTSKVVCTINSGVTVYSTSTGAYALTINGSFPGGVELVNNGTILGKGGSGAGYGSAGNGTSGGPGLLVQSAVTINNGSGRIAGGGGGGGAGANYAYCYNYNYKQQVCYGWINAYGGAGGGGIGNGAGGSGGGGGGTLTAAGAGGAGTWGYYCVGSGGSGGSYGSSGGAGGGPCGGAGGGGYGGGAVVGNSFITWTATGTRNGSIS